MFKVKCKTNIRLFLFTFFYFLGSRLCFPGIPKARMDPRSLCPITWSSWSPRKRLFPPTPSQRPSSKSQTPSRPFNLSIYLLSILKLFQNKNAEKSPFVSFIVAGILIYSGLNRRLIVVVDSFCMTENNSLPSNKFEKLGVDQGFTSDLYHRFVVVDSFCTT